MFYKSVSRVALTAMLISYVGSIILATRKLLNKGEWVCRLNVFKIAPSILYVDAVDFTCCGSKSRAERKGGQACEEGC